MTEPLIITTSPRDGRQLDITIELGPERTQKALHRAARLISQKARIPGFRPGKAPDATVLRLFGRDAVLSEILDDLGQEVYIEALDAEKIEPYGPAVLSDVKTDPLTFTFVVPLQPTVELGDYSDIRLDLPEVHASEADVEAVLEKELESQASLQPVDRPAAIGDTVTVDIRGTVGETEIMNNSDWKLLLKEESGWLPGFDAAFVGLKAGDQKTFTLTYPEDSVSRFKGQPATFEATVKSVEARVRPALDDAFAKSLGDYEGLADLRTKMLEQLARQRTAEAEAKLNNQAIEVLVQRATIAYPPQAVEKVIDEIVRDTELRVRELGYTLEDYLRLQSTTLEQYRDRTRPIAEQRLKGRLVLSEFARREGITVSTEEMQTELDRMVSQAEEGRGADIRRIFDSDAGRFVIERDLLTEKALARLRAVVTGQAVQASPAAEGAVTGEIPLEGAPGTGEGAVAEETPAADESSLTSEAQIANEPQATETA